MDWSSLFPNQVIRGDSIGYGVTANIAASHHPNRGSSGFDSPYPNVFGVKKVYWESTILFDQTGYSCLEPSFDMTSISPCLIPQHPAQQFPTRILGDRIDKLHIRQVFICHFVVRDVLPKSVSECVRSLVYDKSVPVLKQASNSHLFVFSRSTSS